MDLSESELESYALFALRERLPIQVDSIDLHLGEGSIGSNTRLTFTSTATGNPIWDSLANGTHDLFIKGRLVGEDGRGKFDLEEARIDGIPVPAVLIHVLFDTYVTPEYPQADIKAPFDLPLGIQQIRIVSGKATVAY
jgi:hypothetical protein